MIRRFAIFMILAGVAFAQKGGQAPPVPVVQYQAVAAPVTVAQVGAWLSPLVAANAVPTGDTTILGLTAKIQHYASEPDRYRITLCQGPMTPCAQPFTYEVKIGSWQDENGMPREEFRVQRVLTTHDLMPKGTN